MTQDHSQPNERDQDGANLATEFGQQLATAREASGQSMAIVGQQLCINISTIRYLESGQWENAGPDVYVRGYLIAYARLLELDAAEVTRYFRQREQDRISCDSEDIARLHKRPEFARYQRAAGYAIATLLIGPAFIFWVAQGFRGAPSPADTEAMSQQATDVAPLVQETQKTDSDSVQAVATEQPVMASMATMPENLPLDWDNDNQFDLAANANAGTEPDLLLLNFREEVWLEITDHSGNRLGYGLVPASSQRSYSIAQGLSVRLGNADSVVARIDGEVLDLAPFINQDVASFSLPLTPSDERESNPLQD